MIISGKLTAKALESHTCDCQLIQMDICIGNSLADGLARHDDACNAIQVSIAADPAQPRTHNSVRTFCSISAVLLVRVRLLLTRPMVVLLTALMMPTLGYQLCIQYIDRRLTEQGRPDP